MSEYLDPAAFTAGAIGPPGQRVFYLQVREGEVTATLLCEKQQVAALAEYFDGLLDDLGPVPYAVASGDLTLEPPVEQVWRVGSIGAGVVGMQAGEAHIVADLCI